jgi:hypothetical protein
MSLAIRSLPRPRVVTIGRTELDAAVPAGAAPPVVAPATRPPILSDSQLERLTKLVPADVIALYIPAISFGAFTAWRYYALAVTIAATALVPTLLYLDARSSNERASPLQYVVRTVGFLAWAFVIGQPLAPYQVSPVIPALIGLVLPVISERLID